jgi:uncharacterized integral membrane protein
MAVIAAVTAAAVFTLQNSSMITVRFAKWSSPGLPTALILFLTFISGVLVSGLFFLIEVFRLRGETRKFRRMCEALEREVDALRNQPLFDELPTPPQPAPKSFDQRLNYEGQPESSVEFLDPRRNR